MLSSNHTAISLFGAHTCLLPGRRCRAVWLLCCCCCCCGAHHLYDGGHCLTDLLVLAGQVRLLQPGDLKPVARLAQACCHLVPCCGQVSDPLTQLAVGGCQGGNLRSGAAQPPCWQHSTGRQGTAQHSTAFWVVAENLSGESAQLRAIQSLKKQEPCATMCLGQDRLRPVQQCAVARKAPTCARQLPVALPAACTCCIQSQARVGKQSITSLCSRMSFLRRWSFGRREGVFCCVGAELALSNMGWGALCDRWMVPGDGPPTQLAWQSEGPFWDVSCCCCCRRRPDPALLVVGAPLLSWRMSAELFAPFPFISSAYRRLESGADT